MGAKDGTQLINRKRVRCEGFGGAARREEGEYPQGSLTDEQRSGGAKDPQPSGQAHPVSIYEWVPGKSMSRQAPCNLLEGQKRPMILSSNAYCGSSKLENSTRGKS